MSSLQNVLVIEATDEVPIHAVDRAGLRYSEEARAFQQASWTPGEFRRAVIAAREMGFEVIEYRKKGERDARWEMGEERLWVRAFCEVYGLTYSNFPIIREQAFSRLLEIRCEIWSRYPDASRELTPPLCPDKFRGALEREERAKLLKAYAPYVAFAALFLIAFGVVGPAKLVWAAILIPVHHPQASWLAVRVIAASAMAWIVYLALQPRRDPSPEIAENAAPTYMIDNFHEDSAYGDATLAAREQISFALTGRADGLTPRFED